MYDIIEERTKKNNNRRGKGKEIEGIIVHTTYYTSKGIEDYYSSFYSYSIFIIPIW